MQYRGYIILLVGVLLAIVLGVIGGGSSGGVSMDKKQGVDTLLRNIVPSFKYLPFVRDYSRSTYTPRVLNIDLNRATKSQLMDVYGIGEVFSTRILEYRERLGGYWTVEQLREVRGIDSKVFTRIHKNFHPLYSDYNKFYINFALPNTLSSHPYFTKSMVRRIERAKLKGGVFTSLQELIDQDILLPSEAHRVAPYLLFDTERR